MIELIKYNKSAFTLIEITIALLILAVGLVGILALFPVGFDASLRAANITKATFLAQELIEDLKREGYSGPTVGMLGNAITATARGDQSTDYGYPDPDRGYSGDFALNYPNYEYDIFGWDGILDDTGTRVLTGSICEVKVVVYWPANAGGPEYDNDGSPTEENRDNQRNIEFKTYIAKYEP